jgi:sugar phosphate isomerase/epimerase
MKLSVLPVSLFGDISSGKISMAQWAAHAQEAGTDGFDFSTMLIPNHTVTLINKLKADLKAANVRIQPFMCSDYPDFTNPDKLERGRQVDYAIRNIALVSELGFQFMRITAGQNHPGLTIEQGSDYCVECFSRIAPAGEKYGVKLVFENHYKPGAWPLVDFSFNPEAFLAVVKKMEDLPVGVNFDTANAYACGVDPVELLEKVADKVWAVHISDTAAKGRLENVEIGRGLVDFTAFFGALKKHNYSGWIDIEEASGQGFSGIDKAVKFIREFL